MFKKKMHRLVVIFCVVLRASSCRAQCPFGCECFEASRTVKCVSKDLREIPAGIPGYVKNVFITGNSIRRLGHDSFKGLGNVTNLFLGNNGINEVASHTFSSLRMLRSLNLNSNKLALIHPEAFSVPGSPLQELNLSCSLYNHTSLTDLITALRWGGLGSLLSLDMSGNRLILLPPGMFFPLLSLQQLFLGNNSLVVVYNGTFSGLEHLKELDLTCNAFRTISTEGLHELESLGQARLLLSQNPYMCTCGIKDFAGWLNSSRVWVGDAERLSCAHPSELQGTSVKALDVQALGCHGRPSEEADDLTLQTSYVLLGLVLGFVGMVFLFVLYLNRKDMKKWVTDMRDACHDVLEGYHYRYEIDSDPRLGHVLSNNHGRPSPTDTCVGQMPPDTCIAQIPSDIL